MTVAPVEKIARFRALHEKGAAFLFPNFWDAGSARILEGLGFAALASTSSGFALTKGRADYGVTQAEVMAHAREVCAAVDIPVAADLENGFGLDPKDAADTIAAGRPPAPRGAGGSASGPAASAGRPVGPPAGIPHRSAPVGRGALSCPRIPHGSVQVAMGGRNSPALPVVPDRLRSRARTNSHLSNCFSFNG